MLYMLEQRVMIKESGEHGIVVARGEWLNGECRYLVRGKGADGVCRETWWAESALNCMTDPKRSRRRRRMTVDEIAAHVGKSKTHVRLRMQLLALPQIAQEALRAGAITVALAELIGRVPGDSMIDG